MRPSSVLRLLTALGSVAALMAACRVYPDSLLDPVAGSTGGSSGSSGVTPATGVGFWSGTGDNQCFSALQPTTALRPASSDTTVLPAIWLGINRLLLGSEKVDGTKDPDAWKDFGFDLDNTCTASPTCDEERLNNACVPYGLATPPDGNQCRDNTFGNMQKFVSGNATVGGQYGLDDGSFNCGLCYGNFNILIRITGYNGTANDDQVRVDLFGSPGLEKPLTPACDVPDATRLCWLPESPWTIQRSSLANPQAPTLTDDTASTLQDAQAFVRDGYLIAQLPDSALIWFPGTIGTARTFPIQISHGIVSARIARADNGTWALSDAVIGGRVSKEDVLQGFRRVGLCEGQDLYDTAVGYINANLDVTKDPNAPAGSKCDAISMGVVFAARQATPGPLVDGPTLVDCPGAAGASGSAGASSNAGASGGAGAAGDAAGSAGSPG